MARNNKRTLKQELITIKRKTLDYKLVFSCFKRAQNRRIKVNIVTININASFLFRNRVSFCSFDIYFKKSFYLFFGSGLAPLVMPAALRSDVRTYCGFKFVAPNPEKSCNIMF